MSLSSASPLSHQFKTRLCNFKAEGVNNAARATPPFCLRGNFDGRAFNTEYFHAGSMSPMWALDVSFDYHAPAIEALASKFLLIECYGGDLFLGMCRVDLMTLATGPRAIQLSLREGARVTGVLHFECAFELVASVTVQLSRVALQHIAPRGYENNPSPYLAFGLLDGSATMEGPIAANAQSPEWERLPCLHARTTFQGLCDQRIKFELKHSRNGFTAGINDPLMAVFELPLDTLPIEVGRETAVPFRQMVHSLPNYPFPFSTELHGVVEFRGVHRVAQMRAGLLTDEGVVGGVPSISGGGPAPASGGLNVSAHHERQQQQQQQLQARLSSPPRGGRGAVNNSFTAPTPAQHQSYAPLPQPQPMPVYTQPQSINVSGVGASAGGLTSASGAATAAADLRVLDDVAHQQTLLIQQIQTRLQEVNRRRAEVNHLIAAQKMREDAELEAASQRRTAIDADMRMALAERERLEAQLRGVQERREDEIRRAALLTEDRERAKQALEAEQAEIAQLQQRVTVLKAEMTRHLEEEERRYQQRVREAEEARRRTAMDAEALAALEARISHVEARSAHRSGRHSSPPRATVR